MDYGGRGGATSWKQSIWASKDTFHCAKHNQHVLHANARGSGAMPPQKNFVSETESEDILESKYMHVI